MVPESEDRVTVPAEISNTRPAVLPATEVVAIAPAIPNTDVPAYPLMLLDEPDAEKIPDVVIELLVFIGPATYNEYAPLIVAFVPATGAPPIYTLYALVYVVALLSAIVGVLNELNDMFETVPESLVFVTVPDATSKYRPVRVEPMPVDSVPPIPIVVPDPCEFTSTAPAGTPMLPEAIYSANGLVTVTFVDAVGGAEM